MFETLILSVFFLDLIAYVVTLEGLVYIFRIKHELKENIAISLINVFMSVFYMLPLLFVSIPQAGFLGALSSVYVYWIMVLLRFPASVLLIRYRLKADWRKSVICGVLYVLLSFILEAVLFALFLVQFSP
jgi:hypothetical protein